MTEVYERCEVRVENYPHHSLAILPSNFERWLVLSNTSLLDDKEIYSDTFNQS